MLRITSKRSDDVCVIVASDVKMLSWFISCCCTPTTHIDHDYWHKGNSLKNGWCYTAAAADCCGAAVYLVMIL